MPVEYQVLLGILMKVSSYWNQITTGILAPSFDWVGWVQVQLSIS